MSMKNKQEILNGLSDFYGTEQYYKHPFTGVLFTDGIRYMAESCGAFWLIDEIAFAQRLPKIRNDDKLQEIQFWTLTVKDKSAVLTCERDEGDVAYRKTIDYTDFPLDEIKVWIEFGEKPVMLLPSEH